MTIRRTLLPGDRPRLREVRPGTCWRAVFGLVLGSVLVCCAGAPAPAGAAGGEPLRLEETPVGYRWYGKRNGEDVVYEVVSREGRFEIFRSGTGCTWAHLSGDRYSPNLMWKDCGGPDGGQTVHRSADAYPLGIGSRWQYHIEGSDMAGNTWSGVRECRIDTTRVVELHGVVHAAYEVRCRDPWRLSEWVVIPGANISVSSTSRSQNGATTTHEYVRHTLPSP